MKGNKQKGNKLQLKKSAIQKPKWWSVFSDVASRTRSYDQERYVYLNALVEIGICLKLIVLGETIWDLIHCVYLRKIRSYAPAYWYPVQYSILR